MARNDVRWTTALLCISCRLLVLLRFFLAANPCNFFPLNKFLLVGLSIFFANSTICRAFSVNIVNYNPLAGDATDAIQAAIDSGASQVVIPALGSPWIVRPLFARTSHQEIYLEEGAELRAKQGEFQDEWDALLTIRGVHGVSVRGYGATLKMWRSDYQNPALYSPSEHRHAISITCSSRNAAGNEVGSGFATTNIKIEGLRIMESGGDGICLQGQIGYRNQTPPLAPENVIIQSVICDKNHRQGISIIGATNLLIEDSVLQDTEGTAPQAGIDWEPDWQPLRSVMMRNCLVRNNKIKGISLFLYRPVWRGSKSVQITVDRCHVDATSEGLGQGIPGTVQRVPDDMPGLLLWRDCVLRSTNIYGCLEIENKSTLAAELVMERCLFDQVNSSAGGASPLILTGNGWLDNSGDGVVTVRPGGVTFTDCRVHDSAARPYFKIDSQGGSGVNPANISGTVTVYNPNGATVQQVTPVTGFTLNTTVKAVRAPLVTLLSPAHLTRFRQGSMISVLATGNAPDTGSANGAGLDRVVFTVRKSGVEIASKTDWVAPYEASFDTSDWAEGIHIVRARVYSSANGGWNEEAAAVEILPQRMIRGKVKKGNSTGLSGVSISVGSRSTITGRDGCYTITGLSSGANTVTAAMAGYTFTPALQNVTLGSSPSSALLEVNFDARTPFQAWAGGYGLPITGLELGDMQADPDSDGLSNGMEFFFGGNPVVNQSPLGPVSSLVNDRLQVEYTCYRAGVAYAVEASNDLRIWVPIVFSPVSVGQTQIVQDIVDSSNQPRRFLRTGGHLVTDFSVRPDGTILKNGSPFFPFGYYLDFSGYSEEMAANEIDILSLAGCNVASVTDGHLINAPPDYPLVRILNRACAQNIWCFLSHTGNDVTTGTQVGYALHPALIGWNLNDDGDDGRWTLDEAIQREKVVRQTDPGRLNFLSLTSYSETRRNLASAWSAISDIAAVQVYPIAAPSGYDITDGEPIYETYLRSVRYADAAHAAQRSFLFTGQTFSWGRQATAPRYPTAIESRAMTYAALAAGANGFLNYEFRNLPNQTELWNEQKSLIQEVRTLAPFLMNGERSRIPQSDRFLAITTWKLDSVLTIVMINLHQTVSRSCSLILPTGATGLRPLFAERENTLTQSGLSLGGNLLPKSVQVYQVLVP